MQCYNIFISFIQIDCHMSFYNQFHKTNMTCLLKLMTWLAAKYDMDNFINVDLYFGKLIRIW